MLPNIFPASLFQEAQSLAPHFNTLVDRISRDGEFLHKTLGGENGVISKDEYTRKLLDLYTQLYLNKSDQEEGVSGDGGGTPAPTAAAKPNFAKEADRMGIQRSDYMLNGEAGSGVYEMKQVELNTIASSFAGLAVNVAGLHRMLLARFGSELKVIILSCTLFFSLNILEIFPKPTII